MKTAWQLSHPLGDCVYLYKPFHQAVGEISDTPIHRVGLQKNHQRWQNNLQNALRSLQVLFECVYLQKSNSR